MTNEPIEELKKKLVAICPKCGAAFSQPLTEMNEAFGGTGTIWECGEREGNDEQAPGCRIRVLEAELQAANAKLAAIEVLADSWQDLRRRAYPCAEILAILHHPAPGP